MKRAILIALGIGVVVSSAAALDVGGTREPAAAPVHDPIVHAARTRESARAEQRARIDERYLAERERCASLGGYQRDKCLVEGARQPRARDARGSRGPTRSASSASRRRS